jgi:hypothetical protein
MLQQSKSLQYCQYHMGHRVSQPWLPPSQCSQPSSLTPPALSTVCGCRIALSAVDTNKPPFHVLHSPPSHICAHRLPVSSANGVCCVLTLGHRQHPQQLETDRHSNHRPAVIAQSAVVMCSVRVLSSPRGLPPATPLWQVAATPCSQSVRQFGRAPD